MVNKIIGLKVLALPLSLAVVVMLVILCIQPKYSEMRNYKKSVEEGKAQLAGLQDQSQNLARLKSTLQSMEERKIIEVALPSEESVDGFLSEMYQKAVRSGALIDNIEPSQASSSGGLSYSCLAAGEVIAARGSGEEASSNTSPQTLDAAAAPDSSNCVKSLIVDVGVKGTWEQLLNFFRNIAESNRIVNFKKVDIALVAQSGEGEKISDLLDSKITLEIYYKPKSKEGTLVVLSSLAGQARFNKSTISRIKEMVYSPYEAPAVYETGERNIFK